MMGGTFILRGLHTRLAGPCLPGSWPTTKLILRSTPSRSICVAAATQQRVGGGGTSSGSRRGAGKELSGGTNKRVSWADEAGKGGDVSSGAGAHGREIKGGPTAKTGKGPSEQSRPAAAPAPHKASAVPRGSYSSTRSYSSSRSSSSSGGGGRPEPQEDDGAFLADGVPVATFVPRNPRVSDGPWGRVDDTLVRAAQKDARDAAQEVVLTGKPEAGTVLLGQSKEQLQALAVSLGQPQYRGTQVYDHLMATARNPGARGAKSIAELATVPQELRDRLEGLGAKTGRSVVHHSVASPCGTRKLLLQLDEGRLVETVGIPMDKGPAKRLTVCVSSQVGCPMRCTFCATGKGGFARNLRPHEILDQVMTVQEEFGRRVSNVVFMGMGEPLLNLPAVAASYHLLHDGLGISGRAITISTVGVPNAIWKLAAMDLPVTLAVSIHAPNQKLRESIIPSAKVYPIGALMKDCEHYFRKTKRRVTFEYTLLGGVNDQPQHARELAALLRSHNMASHVNVIPWNPVDDSEFERPSERDTADFTRALEAEGVATTLRATRGLEAAAACGQLRNEFQKRAVPEPQALK